MVKLSIKSTILQNIQGYGFGISESKILYANRYNKNAKDVVSIKVIIKAAYKKGVNMNKNKFVLLGCVLFSPLTTAQQFNYQCGNHELIVTLSPNSAILDGKRFSYQDGESDGRTTKMTFYGNGAVLKFLSTPMSNSYVMGLTEGSDFKKEYCKEK
ncbi:hypothetical protein [Zobellella sp. An-6]|uniref:hypothetical protein n=1 Tax=Zobellella sp. An-6 TaxID=3400218 RepID=UPI0040414DD4